MIVERQTAEKGEKCCRCDREMTVKYCVDDIFICGECLYEAVQGFIAERKAQTEVQTCII